MDAERVERIKKIAAVLADPDAAERGDLKRIMASVLSDDQILDEMARRRTRRRWGLCDWCGATLASEPSCDAPLRHSYAPPYPYTPDRAPYQLVVHGSRPDAVLGLACQSHALDSCGWKAYIFVAPRDSKAVLAALLISREEEELFDSPEDYWVADSWTSLADTVAAVFALHGHTLHPDNVNGSDYKRQDPHDHGHTQKEESQP